MKTRVQSRIFLRICLDLYQNVLQKLFATLMTGGKTVKMKSKAEDSGKIRHRSSGKNVLLKRILKNLLTIKASTLQGNPTSVTHV